MFVVRRGTKRWGNGFNEFLRMFHSHIYLERKAFNSEENNLSTCYKFKLTILENKMKGVRLDTYTHTHRGVCVDIR